MWMLFACEDSARGGTGWVGMGDFKGPFPDCRGGDFGVTLVQASRLKVSQFMGNAAQGRCPYS